MIFKARSLLRGPGGVPPCYFTSWREHETRGGTAAVLVMEASGVGVWHWMTRPSFALAEELRIPYVLSSDAYPVLTRAAADALTTLYQLTKHAT